MASWKTTRDWVAALSASLLTAGPAPGAVCEPSRVAPEGPRVTVAGPLDGAQPGAVRLHGAVRGEGPLTVFVDDREARTEADGAWSIELELGIGEHRLAITARDGAGRRSDPLVHHLLVYRGFRAKSRREVVRVSDGQALVEAIRPDRIVVLEPGRYDLSDVDPADTTYVERDGGAKNVRLKGVVNTDLVGAAGLGSTISSSGENRTTLVLDECDRFRFQGVRLEHVDPEGTGGGVLNLRQCYDVWLNGCELTGGGVAVAMLKVNRVRLEGCVIRECTRGILRLKNAKHLRFADTDFVRNGLGRSGDHGVVIQGGERRDQVFVRCRFLENRLDPRAGLFELDAGSVQVHFSEGEILRNEAAALSSGKGADLLKTSKSRVQRF